MEYIRRTNFPFTLQQYKEDFGKPFSKIDLYLCKTYAYDIMKREIATIDNELRQSLDMFTQLFSLEMTLFWQKTSLKIKKDYNKHIYIYRLYIHI